MNWIFLILLSNLLLIESESEKISLIENEKLLLSSHLKQIDQLKSLIRSISQLKSADQFLLNQWQRNSSEQCYQPTEEFLQSFQISADNFHRNLTRNKFDQILPSLFFCKFPRQSEQILHQTKWKNFLFGLISILLINCTSLFGAILLPFRDKSTFKWILILFIGLAVGTLLGTGIFHLIPMAFAVENSDVELRFLEKGLITIVFIYFFYIRDQLMELFFNSHSIVVGHNHFPSDHQLTKSKKSKTKTIDEENLSTGNVQKIVDEKRNEKKSLKENLRQMKAIGWMILIGDLLHGFIDGITIGAIAIVSIPEAIQIIFPITLEEFSHKLGDTAVLLTSGLTLKQSLLMNFLSSFGLYPGFLLGAKLGQMEDFHPWICALAGGMFIYIGLTDMIPELISMGNDILNDYQQKTPQQRISRCLKFRIFLSQNVGLVIGIVLMFLLGKYGEEFLHFSSLFQH